MLTIEPGCDFDIERGPDCLLVRIGNLDFLDADEIPLAEWLWGLLEQHFTYRLVLELDEVPELNRRLIGQLARLYHRIREHDGVLRLCGLSPRNLEAFRMCRLADRLPAYRDRQEAVMGCEHPRQPR